MASQPINSYNNPSNYLDFEIEIGPGAGRDYPVSVIQSPAGTAIETMHFPYDELILENRLLGLQIALLRSGGNRRKAVSPEEKAVQDFGRALFDALISGKARTCFDQSSLEARLQGKGLRLKLRIQSPELSVIPWEYLYDPRQGEFLCLSRDNPLVRYMELHQDVQPLEVTPPLHILGMIASPRDLPQLDIPREKKRITTAIEPLQAKKLIDLEWIEGGTWRELQRAMRHGPWHIFHFIGHGGFDRELDEGFIAFENEDGNKYYLKATEFGRLLADHHSLRLVLLNTCEGGRGSKRDIFSSTASILVRRGMPAVLAMQYEITDRAAIEFSHAFYEALADGLPIDASVSEARKAVSLAVPNTVEWGTPVLYTRTSQGDIFRITKPKSARQRIPKRTTSTAQETERIKLVYSEGLSAFQDEHWGKAANCFQSILDEIPDHSDAKIKLEETKYQEKLALLYQQAREALDIGDQQTAVLTLEEIENEAGEYKDVSQLLASIKNQQKIAELYLQALGLAERKQWQDVLTILDQLGALDPMFADPRGLVPTARHEVEVQKLIIELDETYHHAVRKMGAGQWQEASVLLEAILQKKPDYPDRDKLLKRISAEKSRLEAENKRKNEISALYTRARELVRAAQWQQAHENMLKIQELDPRFDDIYGLSSKIEQGFTQERKEKEQQLELNRLFVQAFNELSAGKLQEAQQIYQKIKSIQPKHPELTGLFDHIEKERSLQEKEKTKGLQIAALYAQAKSLVQSGQWQQASEKLREIQYLEANFPDPDKLRVKIQDGKAQETAQKQQEKREADARLQAEKRKQAELDAMYAEAVQLQQKNQFDDALKKWREIKTRNPNYPDTQDLETNIRKTNFIQTAAALEALGLLSIFGLGHIYAGRIWLGLTMMIGGWSVIIGYFAISPSIDPSQIFVYLLIPLLWFISSVILVTSIKKAPAKGNWKMVIIIGVIAVLIVLMIIYPFVIDHIVL